MFGCVTAEAPRGGALPGCGVLRGVLWRFLVWPLVLLCLLFDRLIGRKGNVGGFCSCGSWGLAFGLDLGLGETRDGEVYLEPSALFAGL